jgi:hypothetical protein
MRAIFVDDVHDYDYSEERTENGVVHILFRSNGEHWSSHVRETEVLSILDTGNGFVFNHGRPKKEMDYSDAFELSVLLKIISFNDAGSKIEISGKKELL